MPVYPGALRLTDNSSTDHSLKPRPSLSKCINPCHPRALIPTILPNRTIGTMIMTETLVIADS
jgi:hypothetical protein